MFFIYPYLVGYFRNIRRWFDVFFVYGMMSWVVLRNACKSRVYRGWCMLLDWG